MNAPLFSGLLLFATAVFATPVMADTPRDPNQYFFNETWNNFQEEIEIAREEGKQGIMFFFESDDCPFCHRMRTTVLNQPAVQAYYRKHFRLIPVDIEGDLEVTDFSGKVTTQKIFAQESNRVRATPVIAFYDLEGKRMTRLIGATNGADEFILLGEYVTSGAYKKSRFSKYKREHLKQNNS